MPEAVLGAVGESSPHARDGHLGVSGQSWFSHLPDVGCDKSILAFQPLPLDVVPEGVFPLDKVDFCTVLACTYKVVEQINYVGTKLCL